MIQLNMIQAQKYSPQDTCELIEIVKIVLDIVHGIIYIFYLFLFVSEERKSKRFVPIRYYIHMCLFYI